MESKVTTIFDKAILGKEHIKEFIKTGDIKFKSERDINDYVISIFFL